MTFDVGTSGISSQASVIFLRVLFISKHNRFLFFKSGLRQQIGACVPWNLDIIISMSVQLFVYNFLSIDWIFSRVTAKAERDLSSLSWLFLCVEWAHPYLRPNWHPPRTQLTSQSKCRIPVTWQQKTRKWWPFCRVMQQNADKHFLLLLPLIMYLLPVR